MGGALSRRRQPCCAGDHGGGRGVVDVEVSLFFCESGCEWRRSSKMFGQAVYCILTLVCLVVLLELHRLCLLLPPLQRYYDICSARAEDPGVTRWLGDWWGLPLATLRAWFILLSWNI